MKNVNFLAIYIWLWSFLGPWWVVLFLITTTILIAKPSALLLVLVTTIVSAVVLFFSNRDMFDSSLLSIKNHVVGWWSLKPALIKVSVCSMCNGTKAMLDGADCLKCNNTHKL